jgi:DNA-binding LytR/AlgR family response regulator
MSDSMENVLRRRQIKSHGRSARAPLPYFFIRQQGRWHKIVIAEIRFIESRKNYCKLSTASGDFMALVTLKRLEALLTPHGFARVHRAYLVSLDWIISFDRYTITGRDEQKLPIGDIYRPALFDRLLLIGDEHSLTGSDPI